eukprot:CAMPEP_0181305642 /NCGR_PEP_ID=MMETSP1101-20121128/9847_1 /TAXON_ID=46948 /ORGANISM="Rhodomonas abbreviata, Strain Caron Lab Isolate" /LENGTH=91 /DNA_ID=CAMNT_0023411589 /DNA_START=235 /DNA_END=510 /DNA_ORIENTATION=-
MLLEGLRRKTLDARRPGLLEAKIAHQISKVTCDGSTAVGVGRVIGVNPSMEAVEFARRRRAAPRDAFVGGSLQVRKGNLERRGGYRARAGF